MKPELKSIEQKEYVYTKNTGTCIEITIANPADRNAFTCAMYEEIASAIEYANETKEITCTVLRGAGGIFSTGHSQAGLDDIAAHNRIDQSTRRYLDALVENKKPLLALVNGPAIGLGCTTLLHADFVVATKRSFFQTPFVDLRVTPEAASSFWGPRLLGYRAAFRLLVLGERWRASQALEFGLIDDLVEDEPAGEEKLQSMVKRISEKPLAVLMAARALVRPDSQEISTTMYREIVEFERHISRC